MVPPLESVERAPETRTPRHGKGLVPMSKKKKVLLMLAKGGVPQSEVAAALHVSKRDVSACASVLRERGLAFDDVAVPSRFLRTFRQPHRPAIRCGYPSNSVTSK